MSVHNARNTVRPTRAPWADSLLPHRAQTTLGLGLLRLFCTTSYTTIQRLQQLFYGHYAGQPALAVTSIYHSCAQESTSEIILKVGLHFRAHDDKLGPMSGFWTQCTSASSVSLVCVARYVCWFMHISLQPIHNSQIHDAVATLLQIPVTTSRQPRGSMRPIYAVTVHRKPRGRSMVGQLGHGLSKNLAGTTMYTVSQKNKTPNSWP